MLLLVFHSTNPKRGTLKVRPARLYASHVSLEPNPAPPGDLGTRLSAPPGAQSWAPEPRHLPAATRSAPAAPASVRMEADGRMSERNIRQQVEKRGGEGRRGEERRGEGRRGEEERVIPQPRPWCPSQHLEPANGPRRGQLTKPKGKRRGARALKAKEHARERDVLAAHERHPTKKRVRASSAGV